VLLGPLSWAYRKEEELNSLKRDSNVPQKLTVVGAGILGGQISLHFALHGHDVALTDLSSDALDAARSRQSLELDARVSRGDLSSSDRDTAADRIATTTDLSTALENADVIIEAVVEKLDVKRRVFADLDRLTPSNVILATNSSSIRISEIESAVTNPQRILNAHFYNPVWQRPVVELMKGSSTTDDVVDRMRRLCIGVNITPLILQKEITGFIFNRIWRGVKRETLHMVNDGVASFEDVDRAWMIALGLPIGPFGMMDRVGLDVVRDIENVYYSESQNPSDAPPPLLLEKIERGELGRKTGKGFYNYPNPAYEHPAWLKGST